MRHRFMTKKANYERLRYFMILLVMYIILNIITYFSLGLINIPSSLILNTILPDTSYSLITTPKQTKIIGGLIDLMSPLSVSKPNTLLNKSFFPLVDINPIDDDIISQVAYLDDYSDMDKLEKEGGYLSDPHPKEIKNPLVYLYCTHQLENYSMPKMEPYNIRPNVMLASYILKEELNKLGIPTIVDETNLADLMRVNAWTYADSYKASRMPLEEAMKQYDTLEYFIDIHRDSPKKKETTLTIDGNSYARVLFVVGLENKEYHKNLEFAKKINAKIETAYPKLSRGILPKKGSGVNGVYNQDLSSKMILLEIGGVDNTIEEVNNTTKIIAQILYNYITGD